MSADGGAVVVFDETVGGLGRALRQRPARQQYRDRRGGADRRGSDGRDGAIADIPTTAGAGAT
ncbi:hypothetical protein O1M54_45675 [Streptomyces diastatochromogenes]|nr:hypothetical protein [Streptomyces diastatochromogenes]